MYTGLHLQSSTLQEKYLNFDTKNGLGGLLYVTSGLGGMSGAQAKAAVITGAVSVIAESNYSCCN